MAIGAPDGERSIHRQNTIGGEVATVGFEKSDKIVSGALREDKEILTIECIGDKRFERTITNKNLVVVKRLFKKAIKCNNDNKMGNTQIIFTRT